MTSPSSAAALRPFLPADVPVLAAIMQESVEELMSDDYGEAQLAAWLEISDDDEAFAAELQRNLTVVATVERSAVGFISLKEAETIEMIYVRPAAAGQGVGSMLCDAIEKLAAARGAKRLVVDATDNAQDFFARRGFAPQRRNTRPLGDEWLGTTTMEKRLAPAQGAAQGRVG